MTAFAELKYAVPGNLRLNIPFRTLDNNLDQSVYTKIHTYFGKTSRGLSFYTVLNTKVL